MPRSSSVPYAWRALAVGGLAAGLAVAAPLGPPRPAAGMPFAEVGSHPTIAAVAVLAIALGLVRPRPGSAGALPWLALVTVVAVLAGLSFGSLRLSAIDARALSPDPGTQVEVRGVVASAPRTSGGNTRFVLETPEGRIGVEVTPPKEAWESDSDTQPSVGVIDEGLEVDVAGTVREPDPWERDQIERSGVSVLIAAKRVAPTGSARGGLRGALDDVRRRAEEALERGTNPLAASLLRGFVLGQDDRIPEGVREEFRRSGLAHVLAVSGQNVMLLAILATPLLAMAGVPLRSRLVTIALIVVVYVPVAGAGASIQRAGVMGIAGVVAALASRPSARWYALALAAVVTLAIDPRATADIGWQLSFCAVAGLLVLAPPLVRIFAGERAGLRRGLAEGAAMTLAATLATAPVAAHHFGTVSLTALPANLLALPAIAPAMWLGMLSGALGQVPGAPVEPLTWLGGCCAGFIGWVAHVLGPGWAQLEVPEPGPGAAMIWTIVLVGSARIGCLAVERRAALMPVPRAPRRPAVALAVGVGVMLSALTAIMLLPGGADRPPALAIRVLDVGQGDAILVQPRNDLPLLVDAGPPDAGTGEILAGLGVDRLAAIAITHDDLDHSGGLGDVLETTEAGHILSAHGPPRGCRELDCPPTSRIASGARFKLGAARAEVVWPPAGAPPGANPNETALVIRITHGEFDALLTADAESEAASYRSGPVEFLKVAHHGSADAGLPTLLDRTSPELAAISVGAGNPYGHPAPETVAALESDGVPVVRTDEDGEILVEVRGDGWSVR